MTRTPLPNPNVYLEQMDARVIEEEVATLMTAPKSYLDAAVSLILH